MLLLNLILPRKCKACGTMTDRLLLIGDTESWEESEGTMQICEDCVETVGSFKEVIK